MNSYEIKLPSVDRKNAFTAIRIICSLIVVFEHFIVLTNVKFPCLGLRGIAVKVFFFLSGFWVTRSFFTSTGIIEFFKKRIKKIFPPYLVIIFVSAFFLVFISTLDFISYFSNSGFWKYLVANISTLNFIHPDLPGVFNGEPVNGSLWTIKIELGFYIILPIIILLCLNKNDDKPRARCIIVLLLIYFLSVLYVITVSLLINKYNLSSSLVNQLPAFMSYFVSGMFCFFFYESLFKFLNKLFFIAAPLLIVCIIIKNTYLTAVFEPVSLAIVVMWIALKARPLFIFSRCYDFSYWLYLVHYPIIMLIKEFLC